MYSRNWSPYWLFPRYDGEDAEPEATRPVAEAPKAEPEAPAAYPEPTNDTVAPPQQQQQQQDDDDAKPFDPAAEEMDGMTNAPHQSYDTSEMDRTPVHMKDDGWVKLPPY
jgi:hypothetical protein